MLEGIAVIFISALALLAVCWMLTEYWLRSVRKVPPEKISNLSVWNRMVFALEEFCGGVNHKKDVRRIWLEEQLGTLHMEEGPPAHRPAELFGKEERKEDEIFRRERKYRIKANM